VSVVEQEPVSADVSEPLADARDTRLLTRVKLKHYKSIAACDVALGRLCFLVGPNGSGKSNFLDALRFVAESLRYSLDHAIRDRGGINEVRRRSGGHPTHLGIRLEFQLADGASGHFAFEVGARHKGAYSVQREQCWLRMGQYPHTHYFIEDGQILDNSFSPAPAAAKDRLYLVSLSGLESFRPLYDALSGMGFYNLNPEAIRDLQPPDPGELLNRDGGNIASVLAVLSDRAPELKSRIEEYLKQVVPGIGGVDRVPIGTKETLEFHQDVRGAAYPWRFPAASMSDGTLRALGVLVALFHRSDQLNTRRHLIGIEEPEVALHPAAAGVLIDALRDAQDYSQVLVTSHSPDLLDDEKIPDDAIRAVVADQGETRIGRLDTAGRSALRDRLYTAGELLRMDQLRPDPAESTVDPKQLRLFGPDS
jgi:predicted ATPase